MHEVPLPTTIGGSKITKDRVSGPPSKMLPTLRDLVESDATVTVEVDTERGRNTGVFTLGRLPRPHEEYCVGNIIVKAEKILAFRVIAVLVDELPSVDNLPVVSHG